MVKDILLNKLNNKNPLTSLLLGLLLLGLKQPVGRFFMKNKI